MDISAPSTIIPSLLEKEVGRKGERDSVRSSKLLITPYSLSFKKIWKRSLLLTYVQGERVLDSFSVCVCVCTCKCACMHVCVSRAGGCVGHPVLSLTPLCLPLRPYFTMNLKQFCLCRLASELWGSACLCLHLLELKACTDVPVFEYQGFELRSSCLCNECSVSESWASFSFLTLDYCLTELGIWVGRCGLLDLLFHPVPREKIDLPWLVPNQQWADACTPLNQGQTSRRPGLQPCSS